MDRMLIVGSNGFTGKHFQQYIRRQHLDRAMSVLGVGNVPDLDPQFPYEVADCSNEETIRGIINRFRPDYIVNLAGRFGTIGYAELHAANAGISRHILSSIHKLALPVKKVLCIGSAAEYGSPTTVPITEEAPLLPVSLYGLTKVLQAHFCDFYYRVHGIPVVVARTFNIIGHGISPQLSVGSFLQKIQQAGEGEEIPVGNLESRRDFLAIDDVVDAYWKLLLRGKSGEVYNVCSGAPVTMRNVLETMIQASGKKLRISVDPKRLQTNDVSEIFGSNKKLVADTGWSPRSNVVDLLRALVVNGQ